MECSRSAIYFHRPLVDHCYRAAWLTPLLDSGCCDSVTRRIALDRNLCLEARKPKLPELNIADVRDGEVVWLSNGVRGFWRGMIVRETMDDGGNAKRHDG